MTKMLWIAALLPLMVGAFQPPPGGPRPHRPPMMHGGSGTFAEVLDGKVVAGAPYSAQVASTSTQTLADGSHITHTVTATVARDSQGRTYRQQALNGIGPWSTEKNRTMVFVRDPVAQSYYVLSPDDKSAIHSRLSSHAGPPPGRRGPGGPGWSGGNARPPEPRRRGHLPVPVGDAKGQGETVEALGGQTIEGVWAEGTRTTRTIPAGTIGNDQPIKIVSETWYSQDLQTVVLSTHRDPRTGESTFRLTNIQRSEPAASLFQVPAGYTVKEQPQSR